VGPPIIDVRGLRVRYPDGAALTDVDLSIGPGGFVLIGGPSGSGKSTLAHALLGLLHREEVPVPVEIQGHIAVAGLSPARHSVSELATQVGLVFQNPSTQLFNAAVEDEVAFGPRNLGLPAEEVAERVTYGLEASGCTHLRGRSVRRLSGGEQQRVAIAASLSMRPEVLVLDEPTANLDQAGTQAVVQALVQLQREHGVTVVVIEHRLEPFLAHAERLVWMDGGRVVDDGPPGEVLERTTERRPRGEAPRVSGGDPLVSVEGVTAGYNGRTVLSGCSLTLRQGQFVGLVGPNGAGKSTLARVLAGLLKPRGGRVNWHRKRANRPRVGFVRQNPLHQLVCQSVEEEVRFGPRNIGMERDEDVMDVLARADLLHLRGRPTQALSVGEQQRSVLAATLGLHPDLLVLDEPTIGQDRRHLRELMDLVDELNREGQTVLLITHDHQLVGEFAGRVWEMRAGTIREGRLPLRAT